MNKNKKIARILEEKYVGKLVDQKELYNFIEQEFKPKKIVIEDLTKELNTYIIKITLTFKTTKALELFLKPF